MGYSRVKGGLDKGTLSPLLIFVLVMDHFSRVITVVGRLLDFKFYPMCKNIKLNHLALLMI